MIECKICNKMFLTLNTHLERKHKIRISEYKTQFGKDTPLYSEEVKAKQSKKATSPFMIKHWVNKGYSVEEAEKLVKPYLEKNAKNARLYSPRCIEHWVAKGFSYGDASAEVSKFQTRDLDFYINLLGEEEGTKKFKSVISAMNYSNSKIGLREKGYTDDEIRLLKDNTSLGAFSKRYGDKLGVERYKSWLEKVTSAGGNRKSKESEIFFEDAIQYCTEQNIEFEEEFEMIRENGRRFFYDLCLPEIKLIFEYDGKMFHADPLVENLNWVGRNGLTYTQSLENDRIKKDYAEENGYTLIRIHSNYRKNYNLVKIIEEFINECRNKNGS